MTKDHRMGSKKKRTVRYCVVRILSRRGRSRARRLLCGFYDSISGCYGVRKVVAIFAPLIRPCETGARGVNLGI